MRILLAHPPTSPRAIIDLLNSGVDPRSKAAIKALRATGQYKNLVSFFVLAILFIVSFSVMVLFTQVYGPFVQWANPSLYIGSIAVQLFGLLICDFVSERSPAISTQKWLTPLRDYPDGCEDFLSHTRLLASDTPHIFAMGRELYVADLVLLQQQLEAEWQENAKKRDAQEQVDREERQREACAKAHSMVLPATD